MKKHHGFTLIEILIALVIFAVIAVITSTALYSVFNTRERVNQHADRLAKLQVAMAIIQGDLEQCSNRPVNTPDQQLKSTIQGRNDYFEFTSGGYVNPLANQRRSTLRRIAYLLDSHNLIRRTWNSLDSNQPEKYKDKIILNDVDSLDFHYFDNDLNILTTASFTPRAVQINLNLANWGKMSLLFEILIGQKNEKATTY